MFNGKCFLLLEKFAIKKNIIQLLLSFNLNFYLKCMRSIFFKYSWPSICKNSYKHFKNQEWKFNSKLRIFFFVSLWNIYKINSIRLVLFFLQETYNKKTKERKNKFSMFVIRQLFFFCTCYMRLFDVSGKQKRNIKTWLL